MIGIVIVSHSATLAEGVRELAQQMANTRVALAVAGGVDNPDEPLGTDPMRVLAAIEQVYSPEGVLVLMDLGSAIMSAEAALEFLAPEQRSHVYLCAAPLVEGTVAAATRAMAGGSIEEVLAEANAAFTAKRRQFPPPASVTTGQPASRPGSAALRQAQGTGSEFGELPAQVSPLATQTIHAEPVQQLIVAVPNRLGLHARPAAKLVALAGNFLADVTVHKANQQAPLSSINQLLLLGAQQGETLTFAATGQEAEKVLVAIQTLIAENLGDKDDFVAEPVRLTHMATVSSDFIRAIPASPGIVVGPILILQSATPTIVERHVADPAAEWWRLQDALAAALIELDALRLETTQLADESTAAIFTAHRAMLQDQLLQDAAQAVIQTEQINAEAAWQKAVEQLAERYRHHAIEYFRERAADILDIGQRVLRHLTDIRAHPPQFDQPSILAARELSPSEAAWLAPEKVLGLITELGGATSHTAILARSLGIPAVVGVGNLLGRLHNQQMIGLDGAQGHIWLHPDKQQLAQLLQQRDQWLAQHNRASSTDLLPATLRDGKRIEIAANITSPQEVAQALAYGAEGVGLFRSEFLYMGRSTPPSEEEHYTAYVTAARALGSYPLIVRTLDIGGDKPISYLGIAAEPNPFLGWRGIRFCLDRPDHFKPQLRALLRAGVDYNIQIMFPMVSTVTEVQQARQLVVEVQNELQRIGLAIRGNIPVGIMIETPAAVLMAHQLAREVDFFSIGTNDLTQYTVAADRGNARVAGLVNALQPAVLRSIQQVTHAAHAAGIWVGVCGELAGNAHATALLIGLGVDELSMAAPSIPAVKAQLRDLTMTQAVQLAEQALALATSAEVEHLLQTQQNQIS